jgi:CheY-like chemotaxis protein
MAASSRQRSPCRQPPSGYAKPLAEQGTLDEGITLIQSRSRSKRSLGKAREVLDDAAPAPEATIVRAVRPDLAILDHRLPDGEGPVTAARIRSVRPDTRVLMLTGAASRQLVVAAVEAGCSGFLTKDKAVHELVAAVCLAHAGRACARSRIRGRSGPHRQDRASGSRCTPRRTGDGWLLRGVRLWVVGGAPASDHGRTPCPTRAPDDAPDVAVARGRRATATHERHPRACDRHCSVCPALVQGLD